MRISDWSSDVCSSDLVKYRRTEAAMREEDDSFGDADDPALAFARVEDRLASVHGEVALLRAAIEGLTAARENIEIPDYEPTLGRTEQVLGLCRSEEHTSELQSLMRISYAVFCLKKKKNNNTECISMDKSNEK